MKIALKIFFLSILFVSCTNISKKTTKETNELTDGNVYLIQTQYGEIKVKLFDSTPIHRDNFKKLVAQGTYDSTLFHRVIDGFMIQGGDPDSKGAPKGKSLGSGSVGYTLDAEIRDTLFHKKGALAAARLGDQMNPERRSSGSQFYIVHGTIVDSNNIKYVENQVNNSVKQKIASEIFRDTANAKLVEKYKVFNQQKKMDSLQYYGMIIQAMIERKFPSRAFKYTEKAKQDYATIGGAPHLDGQYTIFGEVIEGLNIIDTIAKVKKDRGNRPVVDIPMTIKKL